jgi:hypothetical protein
LLQQLALLQQLLPELLQLELLLALLFELLHAQLLQLHPELLLHADLLPACFVLPADDLLRAGHDLQLHPGDDLPTGHHLPGLHRVRSPVQHQLRADDDLQHLQLHPLLLQLVQQLLALVLQQLQLLAFLPQLVQLQLRLPQQALS